MPPKHNPTTNREAWLTNAVDLMRWDLFASKGFIVPAKVRISVGFPQGGRGRIGQCWKPEMSADEVGEVFIHPAIADPLRVLATVAHELVHSINHVAGQDGHGAAFKQIAVAVGLEGKMTATVASLPLVLLLTSYSSRLGLYPHGALATPSNAKKQGTRLLATTCPSCGYKARITARWLDLGYPTCPCGTEMVGLDAQHKLNPPAQHA